MIEETFLPPCSYCIESERFFEAFQKNTWPNSAWLDFNLCCRFHNALLFLYIYIHSKPRSSVKDLKDPRNNYPWYMNLSRAQQVCSIETNLKYVKDQWAAGKILVEFLNGKRLESSH